MEEYIKELEDNIHPSFEGMPEISSPPTNSQLKDKVNELIDVVNNTLQVIKEAYLKGQEDLRKEDKR